MQKGKKGKRRKKTEHRWRGVSSKRSQVNYHSEGKGKKKIGNKREKQGEKEV